MWHFSLSKADNQVAYDTLVWQQGEQIGCSLLIDKSVAQVENDNWCIAVVGRVKPYGAAYPDSVKWLLDELEAIDTSCDSWVEELYARVSGFFILIVGHKQSGEYKVLNDHLGTFPVFFAQRGTALHCATRLKALKNDDTEISRQAIYNYFFHHCIPAPYTLYEGISKMQPGHVLSINHGHTVQTLVYKPNYQPSDQSEQALHQECRQVISDAVSWNAADNCGAFLSGGLDSSTVAGMLATNTDQNKTFSIGFKAKGYDETEYALITAEHFGTQHKTHYLEPDEILQNFVQVAAYYDEPFGNSSALAAYVCANFAKQDDIQVLLAGDGGDEFFGGNERYAKQKVFEIYWGLPSPIRSLADWLLVKSPLGSLPLLKKGRSYIQQAQVRLPDRLHTYNFLNRMDCAQMFDADFYASVDRDIPSKSLQQRYQDCPSAETLEKLLYLDWKFTLADNDLVKVTRMCQKAGVEVRFPLVEKEIVDFSCRVPSKLKLPGMKLRDFYKKSFTGFLADRTINKSKHGFGLPFGVWMKEHKGLSEMSMGYLKAFQKRGIMRPEFVDEAISIYQGGHQGYYGELIWIMLVLEVWLQENED